MIKIFKVAILSIIGIYFLPSVHAGNVDISSSVEITKTRQAVDRVNRVLFSYVTIKNTSGSIIKEPLQLNISNSTIPVLNSSGISEDGQPYLDVNAIDVGAEQKVRVDFKLMRAALSFTPQLFQFQKEIISEELDGQQLHGVKHTDKKSNLIKVLVTEESSPDEIEIEDGITSNAPYPLITNGFVKITNPSQNTGQVIHITPSSPPKYVLKWDENLKAFERVPFYVNEDGTIEIRTPDSNFTFALTE